MGEIDRRHRVKLVVDEWGAWYKPGTEVASAHLLGQQSTMRDALVAALTLDTFHRHADKVVMANIAQLVNCLQSLFLAHEDTFVATPTFHVFEMYGAHVGGRVVRTVFAAPRIAVRARQRTGLALGTRRLGVAEGQHADAHRGQPARQRGARDARSRCAARRQASRAGDRRLAAPDIHAHNTFERPRDVEPRQKTVDAPKSGVLVHRFPPASVTRLTVTRVTLPPNARSFAERRGGQRFARARRTVLR